MKDAIYSEWTCPTCGAFVTSPFCPACGERLLQRRDLSLRGLFDQALHALTSVDGRVFRSAWSLLRRPGALTVAYISGQRKRYVAPFQLFLLANVLFFAVQSFSSSNVFGSTLDSHLKLQDWRETAQAMTHARLAGTRTTLVAYAPVFDRAAENNAKALVIVMTLPLALLLGVLFLRAGRPLVTHAVLSLHVWSFLLVVFSLSLFIADADLLLGGAGLRSTRVDHLLSAFNACVCAAYFHFAIRRVYACSGPARIFKTVVLSAALLAIVLGYRFMIFVVTLYATT